MNDPGTDHGPPEQSIYGTFPMTGWRYEAVEVGYEQTRIVPGRPVMAMVVAGTCAMVNRRRRQAALRLAAPQWRPLGDVTVTATDHRLLVLHQGAWASVWLDAVTEVRPHLEAGYVELLFADDPPYALCGPRAPSLWSALEAILAQRCLTGAAGAG